MKAIHHITYHEALVPCGQALQHPASDGEIHILEAQPMGPDTLYKYTLIATVYQHTLDDEETPPDA